MRTNYIFKRKRETTMKHTILHQPDHIEANAQMEPIPEHILAYDPTAYRSLDGTICTKDPTKTCFYEQELYLPKNLRKKSNKGTMTPKDTQKAEKARIVYLMTQIKPATPEHAKLLEELETLHKHNSDQRLNPGTIIAATTTVLTLLLTLQHENLHVITGKAFSLIPKSPQIK
jgi:hypothetical protein